MTIKNTTHERIEEGKPADVALPGICGIWAARSSLLKLSCTATPTSHPRTTGGSS